MFLVLFFFASLIEKKFYQIFAEKTPNLIYSYVVDMVFKQIVECRINLNAMSECACRCELDQQLWKELGLCGKISSSKVNVYAIAEWPIQVNVKCYDDWEMRLMTRDRLKYRKWIRGFLAGSGDLSFWQSARYILLNWGKKSLRLD